MSIVPQESRALCYVKPSWHEIAARLHSRLAAPLLHTTRVHPPGHPQRLLARWVALGA
jgi:hypothetical protein